MISLTLLAACSQAPSAATSAANAPAATTPSAPTEAVRHTSTAACKSFSELGARIMKARQAGVAMSALMETDHADPTMQRMVIAAYDLPRMSVAENQENSIRDFENDIYLACITGR